MDTNIHEVEDLDMEERQTTIMHLDEPELQEAFSVMEVDDEEMDECVSVATDLRSSKYGVTYTESTMSGISFNYTALFPA